MPSVNKVILIGHLGRDPETRYLPNGTAVCNFSLATTEHWNKDGERQMSTEWHRIEAWNRLAEICGELLYKGAAVYIEGSLKTDEWEDQEGNKRQTTKIKAWKMQMLDRRPEPAKTEGARKQPPSESQEEIPF